MSRFFALSRTTHGVLDMAAPAFCALLWLGRFPAWQTIALSLFTAFAAYTSIYALNDLLGIQCDRQKVEGATLSRGYAVEASTLRHPLAQGILSVQGGIAWMAAWMVVALIGSYILNPAIVLILVVAAGLEAAYCKLQYVTYLRTLVSGLVKVAGPVAAVLVVDRNPEPLRLLVLIGWLFLWEIGGQNIPSDWNYTEQDRRASAQSVPIRFGLKTAAIIVVTLLGLAAILGASLPLISPVPLGWTYVLVSIVCGLLLLLRPAVQLARNEAGELAARLFDRASYYPLSQLLLIAATLLLNELLAS